MRLRGRMDALYKSMFTLLYFTDDRQHLMAVAELAMQLQRSAKNKTN